MALAFRVKYLEKVITEDIPKISRADQRQIKLAIEKKLTTRPEIFGIPLRNSLRGYRKLRVGDYRIIFRIEKSVIKILLIQHRSVVYKNIQKRSN